MKASSYSGLLLTLGNRGDVYVDWTCRNSALVFADAYFDAARTLIEHFRNSPPHAFQTIPVIFLLRHYTELALKECIFQSLVLAKTVDPSYNHGAQLGAILKEHNLSRLLKILSGLNRFSRTTDDSADVPFLSSKCVGFIEELNQCDPTSTWFRYPKNKTLEFPPARAFNLGVLLSGMEQVRDELTELSGSTEVTSDQINEYLNHYADDANYGQMKWTWTWKVELLKALCLINLK